MMHEHEFESVREMAISYIKAGEVMPMSPASVLNLIDEHIKALAEIAAANDRLIAATIPADNNAELARLAIILREQLRGEHGIAIDGPISSMTKLLWAIKQFDTEYARQNPGREEARP